MAREGDHFSSLLCTRRGSSTLPFRDAFTSYTTTGLKANFVTKLVTNEDVQFHWSIATAGFDVDDTEVHEAVLRMITELYITI